MVQLWYPAKPSSAPRARYMPLALARSFEPFTLTPGRVLHSARAHARESAPVAPGRHPVVLLDTGGGEPRSFYTLYAEDLAAHGFVVVAADHTHEARAVVFPGGKVVPQARQPTTVPGFIAFVRKAIDVRVRDARFVLDRLSWLAARGRFAGHLDLAHIGMVGHSLGGAVAAETMLADKRVDAAVDLDGLITPTVARQGLDQPFMVINAVPTAIPQGWPFSEGYTRGPGSLWSRLHGPRFSLVLARSAHYTFTDAVAWQTQIDSPAFRKNAGVGSIAPGRGLASVRAYVNAFFQRYLRGRPAPLLNGPSAAHPEMRFLP